MHQEFRSKQMKSLFVQIRWWMAACCMLAIVSTLVISAGSHVTAESEIAECEVLEALSTGKFRRISHRSVAPSIAGNRCQFRTSETRLSLSAVPQVARSERSQFNGLGTYLLA